MPNLRGKTWTTSTPANVEDAQFWEDHLISNDDASKLENITGVPGGGSSGQVLTKTADGIGWRDPASSGHAIQNADGADMPYQGTLQFLGADVANDPENGKTVVDCHGQKGDAATIAAGTVTMLPAGSTPTVSNSGTPSEAVFDFGLPSSDGGVSSFNGRSGSVLPMAGDYSAEQVNYDSNQTVKQKIDALVTKEASDIAGQQSLLKDTVGFTGKNLLRNTAITHIVSGVTLTANADGSINVDGTATSDIIEEIGRFACIDDTVILSGCPAGGAWNTYRLDIRNDSNVQYDNYMDTGSGIEFTPDSSYLKICIRIANGTTVSNLTFYPMLRYATISDSTYEPYHESVEVMYEEEIHGVNLLKNKTGTLSYQGVTFTTDSNGYITANGLATNYAFWNIEDCLDFSELRVGDEYILSGCPQGGSNSTYCMYIQTSADNYLMEYGQSAKFTYTGTNIIHIAVQIRKGYNANNVVFKPMLRKADIEDSTYRPYNPQAIQNQLNAQGVLGAKNLLENVATSGTSNGISYTVNSDKSISFAGTTTATSYFPISKDVSTNKFLKDGNYILSTNTPLPTGTELWLNGYVNGAYYNHVATMTAGMKEVAFTVTSNLTGIKLYIQIPHIDGGRVVSSTIIYPMIRLASDPDDTYQPYAMTNRELTEKKINISDLKTVVSASSDFADFKTRIASL